MPDPDVIRLLRTFKADLAERETEQMRQMAKHWSMIERSLGSRFDDLASYVVDNEVRSVDRLIQLSNYQATLIQAQVEIAKYNTWVEGYILRQKEEVIRQALGQVPEVLAVALDDVGIGSAGLSFNLLNTGAVEAMSAFTAPATPLSGLLSQAFPMAAQSLTEELIKSVAMGTGPKALAKVMNEAFGVGMNRSLLIARTETLRSYRESSRYGYEKSGLVEAYQRVAFHSRLTCPACLMADGTIYPVQQYFIEHVQGRCILVPVLKTVGPWNFKTGRQWFEEQPGSVQRDILGPGRYELWQSGGFDLSKLVTTRKNNIWGDSLRTATLRELSSGITVPGTRVFASKQAPVAALQPGTTYTTAGRSLTDLEALWYRLQNDTSLTQVEKAEIAKSLRKAVRAQGGSVTTFTGPKPPPAGPILESDWFKYRSMTLDELKDQYTLLKDPKTVVDSARREELLKRLRKTVREKGGSVANWSTDLTTLTKPPVRTGTLPSTKPPVVHTGPGVRLSDAEISRRVELVKKNREVFQYYPEKVRTYHLKLAELDVQYAKGMLTDADYKFQQWKIYGKYPKVMTNPTKAWPKIRMTDEEARTFKFKSTNWSDLKVEIKDRLDIDLTSGSPPFPNFTSREVQHIIEELERSVRSLNGVLPGTWKYLELTTQAASGKTVTGAIADASHTGKIRVFLDSPVWGDRSQTLLMQTTNWVTSDNSLLHEIWHEYHYDNFYDWYKRSKWGTQVSQSDLNLLAPSRYGRSNAFEYIAEVGSGLDNPRFFLNKAQYDFAMDVGAPEVLGYFARRTRGGYIP